jgi:predicted amidophosphoribosyltransferase
MTHSRAERIDRFRGSIQRWFQSRVQESVHCCQCQSPVSPWDTHCPTCGQANPARVSPSAAVYIVVAFVLLALVLSSLVLAF